MAVNEFTGKTDAELQDARMVLEDDVVRLKNRRHLNPSLEDAMGGYEALVAEAYQLVAAGWAQQAASLRAVGRVGSDTVEWRLPTRFTEAVEIVRDFEGPKAQLAAIQALEYGPSNAENVAEVNQKREKIGLILAELAFRQAERSTAQAAAVYADELSKISGG